jgi:vesicle transport protein SEC22
MPPLLTQIARVSDGLPLVAIQTPAPGIPVTPQDQQQAKELLRKITTGANKMSISAGDKVFCYMTRDSLCFLVMTESKYPKRLAFLYLDEVCDLFLQQLVTEFGNSVSTGVQCHGVVAESCLWCHVTTEEISTETLHAWSVSLLDHCSHITVVVSIPTQFLSLAMSQWRGEVDQTARPFRFIHYDPIIQRKQKEFQDERQQRSKLNDDLSEIQSIMKKNITDILDRGEKLDNVQNISQDLMSKSSNFKWGTRKLTLQARIQQYAPIAVIVFIVLFVIYVKFFW